VAVLVHLLVTIVREQLPHRNFFVVFTVGEETGLFGAGTVQIPPATTSGAYVFDCSKPPGTYIREAAGLHTFAASFFGKPAHAGVAPEEGVSAIQMACAAVSHLRLGRIDADTTANVGRIRGGEALNAIPAFAMIEGEVRSFSVERIGWELGAIEQTLRTSAGGRGKVEFTSKEEFQSYTLRPEMPLLVDLECAMRSAGLTPHPIRYTGGSDANRYNAKGFPAVNLGIGAQKPHSHDEYVLIEDLKATFELAMALVRQRNESR
jgi:tripeptide aminopeptidase